MAKQKLTEDEKLQRRAARKAEAINTKALADAGPLYADQVPAEDLTTPTEQYWAARKSWATAPRGVMAADLIRVDFKVDVLCLRNLARRVMSPADFALANEKQGDFGDLKDFWRNILLGRRRIVIAYERISHGWRPVYLEPNKYRREETMLYMEQVALREKLVWPPAGYTPPMTAEQLEQWFADMIPEPAEMPGAVDPLGLMEAI